MAVINRRRTRPERTVSGRVLGMMYRVGMLAPLLLFAFALISAITVFVLMVLQKIDFNNAMKMLGVSVVSMIIMFWIMLSRMRNRLLDPLSRLEASIARVISGEPDTHISLHAPGVLKNMVEDIRSINDELNELYDDMDQRVAQQTSRLAQKTASLKILYDVAASINQADSLDELLLRFLRILKQMVNAQAATVRLMQPNGVLRLVGAMGPNNQILREREMLPLDLCVCGKALSPGDILCENRELHCVNKLGRTMFTDDQIEKVTVNLEYQDQLLGQYQLHVAKKGVSEREDILQLLETIGSHLGMAVAKQSSDIEARRLSLVDERTALAHELHDSLAQTLASLRFQVRLLQDEIQKGDPQSISDDMLRLKNGIDEAHDELRELLHSFRAPVDQKGLANALENMTNAFEKDTGVKTFFQKEWTDPRLTPSEEVQIMRIAQEALANIRKHAKANVVRMLLTFNKDKGLSLLVEDDGVGFDSTGKQGKPGEHVGLTIMEERAGRLGGSLRIESEPGEGTQVELHYQPSTKPQQPEKRWII